MKLIDWLLYRVGVVRRSRYDHLYQCYRDVWGYWEKCLGLR
jgi:hypothetical protein